MIVYFVIIKGLTLKNGMMNCRSGWFVTVCISWWNSSMVAVPFWRGRKEGGEGGSGRVEGGREGGRKEGGREGGREGGKEGKREWERGKEGRKWREGGKEVEGGREGGKEVEGGTETVIIMSNVYFSF